MQYRFSDLCATFRFLLPAICLWQGIAVLLAQGQHPLRHTAPCQFFTASGTLGQLVPNQPPPGTHNGIEIQQQKLFLSSSLVFLFGAVGNGCGGSGGGDGEDFLL